MLQLNTGYARRGRNQRDQFEASGLAPNRLFAFPTAAVGPGGSALGAAMLTALTVSQRNSRAWSGPAVLIGRTLAHVTLYVPALALFLVILPRIYGFSTLGTLGALALFVLPFILAVSLMGQFAGLLFKHRETAVLVFVATS